MRIFLALAGSPNPTFASSLWMANLHDPLVRMGHDVVHWDEGTLALFDFPPDAPETAAARGRYSERFLDAVIAADRAARLDLVLTYVSDSHLEPSAIDRVRETVAPIVNFFCNNVHQFHLIRRSAPRFSVCLVPERAALGAYERVGARPVFFPMAANPDVYRPVAAPTRYEATFAGQRYADRASNLLALRDAGIDAHAFGQGWSAAGTAAEERAAPPGSPPPGSPAAPPHAGLARIAELLLHGRNPLVAADDLWRWRRLRERHPAALHPPATDEEYVALFSESKVSLGFLVLGDTHRTLRPLRQVRLREFEAPMSGAFYLTEYLEEIGLHYEIGTEIVCFRSREELVDRCRYYLLHEGERERIRRAGHARARRDHTWTRRFETLFGDLALRGILRAG
ncbi:MAG TPA: glycosyltransferase [Candidatus Eisenbacteria bacterium]